MSNFDPGGVFTNSNSNSILFNHTNVNNANDGHGHGGGGHEFDFFPPGDKFCLDMNRRKIPVGYHFVPGPDECTLCICEITGPKWCKAVLCQPPTDCKSFRVGTSCCDFICLDDSLTKGNGGGGDGKMDNLDIQDVLPKLLFAAVTAMLTLSLLFFLIHRLRKRHIQGRLNSTTARRNDESPSLDSMDYFEHGIPHHNRNALPRIPPEYQNFFATSSQLAFAWLKPPDSYFGHGGSGEAPPPYEEACSSSSVVVQSVVNPQHQQQQPAQTVTTLNSISAIHTNTEETNEPSAPTLLTYTDNPNHDNVNDNVEDENKPINEVLAVEPIPGTSSQVNIPTTNLQQPLPVLKLCGGNPNSIMLRNINPIHHGIPPPTYSVNDRCSNRRSLTLPRRVGIYSDDMEHFISDQIQPPPPPIIIPAHSHVLQQHPLEQNTNSHHRQRLSLQLDVNWNDSISSSSSSSSSSTISINSSTTTHTPTTPLQARRTSALSSSSSSE